MASYYAKLDGTRICADNANRTPLAADDTDYSGISKTSTFIYCVQIGQNGKDTVDSTYQLMFRKVGDASFANVTSTTAVKYVTSSNLVDTTLITGPYDYVSDASWSKTARCT